MQSPTTRRPRFTTRTEKVADPDGGPDVRYMVLDVNGTPYMRSLFGNYRWMNDTDYSICRADLIACAVTRLAKFPQEMP